MSRLFIANGTIAGHSIEIDKEVTTLGRGINNDIQLNENSISRDHLKITKKEGSLFIEDLGSHNGTIINGYQLEPGVEVEITIGDSITLGNINMVIQESISEDHMKARYTIDLESVKKKEQPEQFAPSNTMSNGERLGLLYKISTFFMETLDIDDICEKIMEALFKCLERIDDGAIILENKKTGELEAVITRERRRGKSGKANYSKTIVKKVMQEGSAVIMCDTKNEDSDELSESIEMMKVKSIMCVPLICKSKILGVIYVHSTNTVYGFNREDLYLFTGFSTPAALAIENALLYSELKEADEKILKTNDELERRVTERTKELSEANKNLQMAYSRMRKEKDLLGEQLQGNARGLIINKDGLISGVTDEILECSGMSRIDLVGKNIIDIVDGASRDKFKTDMAGAFRGISVTSFFKKLGNHSHNEKGFAARMTLLNTQSEKQVLLLIDEA